MIQSSCHVELFGVCGGGGGGSCRETLSAETVGDSGDTGQCDVYFRSKHTLTLSNGGLISKRINKTFRST